jgi:hypothetical protein
MNTTHSDKMALEFDTSPIQRRDVLTRTLELIGERKEMSRRAREAIARENQASAETGPRPTDQRLVVIDEIVRRLQGSIIAPEDRTALLACGRARGLRCFDTNLLIAMVQDRARRGETPGAIALAQTRTPVFDDVVPGARTSRLSIMTRLLCATAGGLGLTLLAAAWLLGGS